MFRTKTLNTLAARPFPAGAHQAVQAVHHVWLSPQARMSSVPEIRSSMKPKISALACRPAASAKLKAAAARPGWPASPRRTRQPHAHARILRQRKPGFGYECRVAEHADGELREEVGESCDVPSIRSMSSPACAACGTACRVVGVQGEIGAQRIGGRPADAAAT